MANPPILEYHGLPLYQTSKSLLQFYRRLKFGHCFTANNLVPTSKTYLLSSFCFHEFITSFFHNTIISLRWSMGIGDATNAPPSVSFQSTNQRNFLFFIYIWIIPTTFIHNVIYKQTHHIFKTNVYLYWSSSRPSTISLLSQPLLYVFHFLHQLLLLSFFPTFAPYIASTHTSKKKNFKTRVLYLL